MSGCGIHLCTDKCLSDSQLVAISGSLANSDIVRIDYLLR